MHHLPKNFKLFVKIINVTLFAFISFISFLWYALYFIFFLFANYKILLIDSRHLQMKYN